MNRTLGGSSTYFDQTFLTRHRPPLPIKNKGFLEPIFSEVDMNLRSISSGGEAFREAFREAQSRNETILDCPVCEGAGVSYHPITGRDNGGCGHCFGGGRVTTAQAEEIQKFLEKNRR